jgi:transposase
LVTNVTDLPAADLVRQHKDLADIERGFRVLKSQIEIAPVYHRLPERIRAHTFICFLAFVIQRVMRYRLKKNGFPMSPEELLYRLRAVQHHRVRLGTGKQLPGVTTIRPEQQRLFKAIEVEKPTGGRV